MPVQTDTPVGIGIDDWGLWGSAPDKIAAVQTNDGDTSVIYGFSKGREVIQQYTFTPILGVADPVTSASINCVVKEYEAGNATRNFYLRWNGANAGSNIGETIHLFSHLVYGTYGHSAGAATLAAVNGQHGVYMNSVSGTGWEVWVTHIYRVVTFDFAGGGASLDSQFAHLIGSLGAAIGANLLLRDMQRLNRALGNVKLRPDELETAWKAWKSHRFPAWSV